MKKIILAIVLLVFVTGCVKSYRVSRNFDSVLSFENKVVAVVLPEIKINEFTAGGIANQKKELSDKTNERMLKALSSQVEQNTGFAAVPLKKSLDDVLGQQRGMWDAVYESVVQMTYTNSVKEKENNFDYTIASGVESLKNECDYLLVCSGESNFWSTGRAVMSFLTGAVIGVSLQDKTDWLSSALIDVKTGQVIWFNLAANTLDLRADKHIGVAAEKLLESLKK